MMRENPPKDCRGETKDGKDLGCGNTNHRKNNIDTA